MTPLLFSKSLLLSSTRAPAAARSLSSRLAAVSVVSPAAASRHASHRTTAINTILKKMSSARSFSASLSRQQQQLRIHSKALAHIADVDSTVISEEGIDEFASFLGDDVVAKVAEITKTAMEGDMPFQDALKARLEIMQPSSDQLKTFLTAHPSKLTPGMQEVIDCIRKKGMSVYLVSGGFVQMIAPVAARLGIPRENIYANEILFDSESGLYSGFDVEAFTSRAGGKTEAIRHLKKTFGYETVVMVGDGGTDYEARRDGAADGFIGYGGVATREIVQTNADWFIRDWAELLQVLKE